MKITIYILTVIFFSNFVGMYFGMYSHWWFDMSLHFLGGFFIAILMARYLADVIETSNKPPKASLAKGGGRETRLKKYLIIVGAVSFIGVVWEFAEYLAAQTLIEPLYNNFGFRVYFIGDLSDTINDLLMDVVGAFSWLTIFRKRP